LEIPTYVPSAIWDCNQCLQFANALFAFIRLNTVAGMRYTLAYNSDQVQSAAMPFFSSCLTDDRAMRRSK
jgi:hypothetical protein